MAEEADGPHQVTSTRWPNPVDSLPGRPWMTLSLRESDESRTQPDRAWEGVCLPTSWQETPTGYCQV